MLLPSELVLKAHIELTEVQLTYYEFPEVASATYASWIANRYPDLVVERAAAEVFKAIGKDDEAAKYSRQAQLNALDLLKDEISL